MTTRTALDAAPSASSPHYASPGRITRRVLNPLVRWLTRRGLSLWGSRVLEVPGRSTGQWRATPVNLLDHDGRLHLVAARGETQWVRNLRASGTGRLRLGRHTSAFRAVELPTDARVDVLRAYLRRWSWEVGAFFDGVSAASTDDELAAVAHRHPVFALTLEEARLPAQSGQTHR